MFENTEKHKNEQLNHSMGFKINVAARAMRISLENGLKDIGLVPTQWIVLKALFEHGQMNQSDLGKVLFLDNATITRQIDKLASMDFLERGQDENDRRVHLIGLTTKGKRLISRLDKVAMKINESALQGLSLEKAELFMEILDTIFDNLSTGKSDRRNDGG